MLANIPSYTAMLDYFMRNVLLLVWYTMLDQS